MLLQLFLPSISNFRLGSFSKGSNQWWVQCRFGCPNFVPKFSGQSQLTYSPRQKEILGIQCDRLISDFKGPKTIALVREKIRQIPDGSLSHCARALNLVFQKAFELRKKRRHPPWAKLRCSNPGCSWIKTPSRSRLLRQSRLWKGICVDGRDDVTSSVDVDGAQCRRMYDKQKSLSQSSVAWQDEQSSMVYFLGGK